MTNTHHKRIKVIYMTSDTSSLLKSSKFCMMTILYDDSSLWKANIRS